MSDEEAKKLTPYKFTIRNVCNTIAFYQVNLEELEVETKRLSNQYIKVSLNNSNSKNLNTYQEVEPTIDIADISHKLTSGTLKENEEITYELKLWMDDMTPLSEDVMNATFISKVSIINTYKNDITNDLKVEAKSLNTDYSNIEEIIEFKAISKNYKIIEYSEDNITYHPIENPDKQVIIEKKYKEYGTYFMYFKDEVGNISFAKKDTEMLDQLEPIAKINAKVVQNKIVITDKSTDNLSGIVKREYKIDNGSWIEGTTSYTVESTPGTYNVAIRVTDKVGYTSTYSTSVTIAKDTLIYSYGTAYSSYDNVSQRDWYASFNSNYINLPHKYHKTVAFKKRLTNNHRYLKIIATAVKNSAYGGYYLADFGITKSIAYNSSNRGELLQTQILRRNWIIVFTDSSKLNDYETYRTFTIDLDGINENYYVYLHNCDTIFNIQKIWLTNNL